MSTLLGDPPDIDEGPMVQKLDNITKENKRVKIGTDVYVVDGYNVTIDCNIVSGTTPITYSWLLNGTEFRDNNATITITDATYDDVITCRANNTIGFDEESTTIHVNSKLFHYTFSICNMGMGGLPDMYTQSMSSWQATAFNLAGNNF